jgi:gas vesicle protein
MDEGNVHEEGFVRNAVSLHKEVRESIKDLTKFQDQWGTMGEGSQVNQTINILNVELAKESPETWKRIKSQLQETVEGME